MVVFRSTIGVGEEGDFSYYHFYWFRCLTNWILKFGHLKKEIFEKLEVNAHGISKNTSVMWLWHFSFPIIL